MARAWFACLLFSAVLLASNCAAQQPEPGTFSTGPVQPYGGLILTTPSMSLGNGIDPPVVSNQAPVYLTAPQPGRGIPLSAWASAPWSYSPPDESPAKAKERVRLNANLIYPSGISLSSIGSAAGSLGDAARAMRQEAHPPAKRVYTNDDIARLSAQEQPGGVRPSSSQQPVAEPPQAPPQSPQSPVKQERPRSYTVPIGSAPPPDVVPAEEPAQRAQTPPQRRSGNPFEPKVREAAPSQGEQAMGSPTFPPTASILPLLGGLGGALVAGGLIYRSLRG